MSTYRFSSGLSAKGIEKMRKQLINYKENILQQKVDLLAKALAERGADIAQANVAKLDAVFTGELIDSIHTRFKESGKGYAVFCVVADSDHAVFVEFGTGQRGMEAGYPYPFPEGVSWDYATGKTIKQNPKTGAYYWFYPGDDGKWHYTEGMPSRPFMYEANMELYQETVEIAKKIFG